MIRKGDKLRLTEEGRKTFLEGSVDKQNRSDRGIAIRDQYPSQSEYDHGKPMVKVLAAWRKSPATYWAGFWEKV